MKKLTCNEFKKTNVNICICAQESDHLKIDILLSVFFYEDIAYSVGYIAYILTEYDTICRE